MAPTLAEPPVVPADQSSTSDSADTDYYAVPGLPEQDVDDSSSVASTQVCKKTGKTVQCLTFSPDSLKHIGKTVEPNRQERYTQIGESNGLAFKMVRSDTRLVRTLLHSYGFTQCSSKNPSFNVIWTGAAMQAFKMRALQPWQRLNQFPRSTELTRKDKLYENIARAVTLYGDAYEFIPEFYVTPRDSVRMTAALERASKEVDSDDCSSASSSSNRYIVKPVSASQGRGIFFTDKAEDIPRNMTLLVSRYIDDPLLVNGHKFDLRIYVAVTSFYPLVTYIYSEGLTRFASGKYCRDASPEDEFVHLTNYSINKNNKDFVRNESMSSEDLGHKWTLGALLRHLEKQGKDSKFLMLRIEDLVIKSLLSVQGAVAALSKTTLSYVGTNFELFGFDVLVDENLKPWLLEVNLSPSLSCDAPLDSLIKPRLICDLFNLACIPVVNKKWLDESVVSKPPKDDDDSGASSSTERSPTPSRVASPADRRRVAVKRNVHGTRVRPLALPLRLGPVRGDVFGSLRNATTEMRVNQYAKKLHVEEERKGDFIRIFPRKGTYHLYRDVMEPAGCERLDRRLYEREFGEVEDKQPAEWSHLSAEFHDVMMMPGKYPSLPSLSCEMEAILRDWYATASAYTAKVTKEGEVYAAKLPVVRTTARLRTRSCSEFYEQRKATQAELKARAAAEAAARVEATQIGGAAGDSASSPAELGKENASPITV